MSTWERGSRRSDGVYSIANRKDLRGTDLDSRILPVVRAIASIAQRNEPFMHLNDGAQDTEFLLTIIQIRGLLQFAQL
jgi:hypothetical protein